MSAVQDWTAPGAHEVVAGIYRIPLPLPSDGLRAVNVYAVPSGEQVVLIDGGWALEDSEVLLARSLDTIGYGLGDIARFLVTHAHRDHYTQAVAVRRRFGARVVLGEHERDSIERIAPDAAVRELPQMGLLTAAGADELVRTLRNGAAEKPDRSNWEAPDDWLSSGARLRVGDRTLEVLHTPGHTRGHLVFHDRSARVLFAGDHVLPHITPSIGFESAPVSSPLTDYLTSLHLVRAMPDALLLPAHGPTATSVHERVDQLLAHHEARLEATLTALRLGAETAFEVAAQLGWTRRLRTLVELDPFNQMLAILETVAHLEVLTERGLVSRDGSGRTVRYGVAA
jgi:glyoxylase-like metal-dependent hydrolase (beta-lactamase superfamily II)